MFYVYILKSKVYGKHYTGQAKDVEKRVEFHNSSRARSTKKYQPWYLAYVQEFESRSEAVKKELEIKKLKDTKKFLSSLNK